MTIINSKGVELLLDEEIRLVRDYTFDEDAVLGKFAEEDVLRKELSREAAEEISRRLNATINSNR
jgi:outer membrane lipopolysaccharide assembly protein LptE/RlpB